MTQVSKKLRALADEVDMDAARAPQSAEQLIARYAPSVLNVEIGLDLRFAGMQSFDVRRELCGQAGRRLGDYIAKTLDYEYEYRMLGNPFYQTARYRASIYALTPHQLKELLKIAYRVGKENR